MLQALTNYQISIIYLAINVTRESGQHSHLPDVDEINRMVAHQALEDAVRRDPTTPVRRTYNQTLRGIQRQGGGKTVYLDLFCFV